LGGDESNDLDLVGHHDANTVGSFPPVSVVVVNHLRILRDLKKIVIKNDQGDYEISDQKKMKLLMENVESFDLGPIGEQSHEFNVSDVFLGDEIGNEDVNTYYAMMASGHASC
jgi:hypothetical protein